MTPPSFSVPALYWDDPECHRAFKRTGAGRALMRGFVAGRHEDIPDSELRSAVCRSMLAMHMDTRSDVQ